MHPETDAEKVQAVGDRITKVSRLIPAEEATGEYIGVAGFTPAGAARLREYYHRVVGEHGERPFREASSVRMAYLIHLYQDMLERGVAFHFFFNDTATTEIYTTEDYRLALEQWG